MWYTKLWSPLCQKIPGVASGQPGSPSIHRSEEATREEVASRDPLLHEEHVVGVLEGVQAFHAPGMVGAAPMHLWRNRIRVRVSDGLRLRWGSSILLKSTNYVESMLVFLYRNNACIKRCFDCLLPSFTTNAVFVPGAGDAETVWLCDDQQHTAVRTRYREMTTSWAAREGTGGGLPTKAKRQTPWMAFHN